MEPIFVDPEPVDPVIWYMCKHCGRSYTDMEELFQHKFANHKDDFLGLNQMRKPKRTYNRRTGPPTIEEVATDLFTKKEEEENTDPTIAQEDSQTLQELPRSLTDVKPRLPVIKDAHLKSPSSSEQPVDETVKRIKRGRPPKKYTSLTCKICRKKCGSGTALVSHQRVHKDPSLKANNKLTIKTESKESDTSKQTVEEPADSASPERKSSIKCHPEEKSVKCAFCLISFKRETYVNHRKTCAKRLDSSFTRRSSFIKTATETWIKEVDTVKKIAHDPRTSKEAT